MKIQRGLAIKNAAQQFTKKTALVWEGGSETFAEMNRNANKAGALLAQKLGVPEGGGVGVLSFNRPEIVHCWLGCEKYGLARIALHAHVPMELHVQLIKAGKAHVLLFDTRFAEQVEAHLSDLEGVKIVAFGPAADKPDWAQSYEELIADASDAEPLLDGDPQAPFYLQPTSGTTGAPKIWAMSHVSYLAMVEQNLQHLDNFGPDAGQVGPDDACLHFHAVQWASGAHNLYPLIIRGGRTVLIDDSDINPALIVDTMVNQKITTMFMPGPLLPPILEEVEKRGGIDHSIKRMIVFFGTPELLEAVGKTFGNVWCHAYGATEMGGVATRVLWSDCVDHPKRLSSIGRPAAFNFQIDIVDDRGELAKPGEVGEIRARSAMSRGSYVDRPELAPLDENGFLMPRDLAFMDDDGFIYYVDRCTDTITIGERAVYPHVVEEQVLANTGIMQAGVVAANIGGKDCVVAGVTVSDKTDTSDAGLAQILETTNSKLAAHQQLEQIIVLDELPTVLSGAKVQRAALQEQIAQMQL